MIIHIKDQEPGTFIRVPDHEGAYTWNAIKQEWVPLNEFGLPHVIEATPWEKTFRTFELIDCKYKILIRYKSRSDKRGVHGAMIAADDLFIKTDRTKRITL